MNDHTSLPTLRARFHRNDGRLAARMPDLLQSADFFAEVAASFDHVQINASEA